MQSGGYSKGKSMKGEVTVKKWQMTPEGHPLEKQLETPGSLSRTFKGAGGSLLPGTSRSTRESLLSGKKNHCCLETAEVLERHCLKKSRISGVSPLSVNSGSGRCHKQKGGDSKK